MIVTHLRLQVITSLRMQARCMGAEEISALIPGSSKDSVQRCLRGLEKYGAIGVDRTSRPFAYALLPAGYVAVGSFPPKRENT